MLKQICGWNNQIIVDEYIIMPNYFHCVLIIADNEFNKPIENSENDNEFVLVRNAGTIYELYLRVIKFKNR